MEMEGVVARGEENAPEAGPEGGEAALHRRLRHMVSDEGRGERVRDGRRRRGLEACGRGRQKVGP